MKISFQSHHAPTGVSSEGMHPSFTSCCEKNSQAFFKSPNQVTPLPLSLPAQWHVPSPAIISLPHMLLPLSLAASEAERAPELLLHHSSETAQGARWHRVSPGQWQQAGASFLPGPPRCFPPGWLHAQGRGTHPPPHKNSSSCSLASAGHEQLWSSACRTACFGSTVFPSQLGGRGRKKDGSGDAANPEAPVTSSALPFTKSWILPCVTVAKGGNKSETNYVEENNASSLLPVAFKGV